MNIYIHLHFFFIHNLKLLKLECYMLHIDLFFWHDPRIRYAEGKIGKKWQFLSNAWVYSYSKATNHNSINIFGINLCKLNLCIKSKTSSTEKFLDRVTPTNGCTSAIQYLYYLLIFSRFVSRFFIPWTCWCNLLDG